MKCAETRRPSEAECHCKFPEEQLIATKLQQRRSHINANTRVNVIVSVEQGSARLRACVLASVRASVRAFPLSLDLCRIKVSKSLQNLEHH